MKIPEPKDKMGYTTAELLEFMTLEKLNEFNRWMEGQTCSWNGDHETIYYTCDVQRFMSGKRTVLD